MKKSQENFKNFNGQKIQFFAISFRLIIFVISLVFLVESIF